MGAAEPDPVRASLERALGAGYRILRLLGRGGMGAVYLAREESLERLVAVKVLSHERGLDEASRERFKREARTAAHLTHPNIVPLHAFGDADGFMYHVMGYVSGESLAARLKRDGRLSPPETRRILADLADALDHAHRQDVVHRDIKPDNVMIDDESGRALLLDFGIAKAGFAGGMTQAGALLGTPHYMSPEQAGGSADLDGRSDLYSLGVLAYTMLAGRPPFEGADAGSVMARHLTQAPPSLASVRPDVPEDLAATVARCLAKNPAARWQNARTLREAVLPTRLEEDELPEPLDGLDGRAAILLLFAAAFAATATYAWLASLFQGGASPAQAAPLLAVATGGLFVYQLPWQVSAARLARRRGFSARQVAGAFLRQPAWWQLWYPRPFRRAADVWDRLPRPFRWWRISMTLLSADLLILAPLVVFMINNPGAAGSQFGDRLTGPGWLYVVPAFEAARVAVLPLALLALVSLALCARRVLALGLDVYERRRITTVLLTHPTSQRAAWKRPEIARLLAPAPAPPEAAEPRSPRELLDAISRAGLERAAGEGRAIAAELLELDAELARLGREMDPDEAARLQQRLLALGPASASEGDERREMRRLLSEQASLLARVSDRLEAARERRAQRLQELRDLWRQARSDSAPTLTRPGGESTG